ncbi:hypothetical protein THAOC_12039, partial [Thalassiosira oceanica]
KAVAEDVGCSEARSGPGGSGRRVRRGVDGRETLSGHRGRTNKVLPQGRGMADPVDGAPPIGAPPIVSLSVSATTS